MNRRVITALGLALIALGTAYSVYSMRRTSAAAQVCDACLRPIHLNSKTVAEWDGRRDVFCCPACALTAHRQSGRAVQVVHLTDYETGARLSPRAAFLVRGSDMNPCDHHHVTRDAAGRPAAERFDRCTPSLLAFASRGAAARFAAAHGGAVIGFAELAAAYR